MTKLKTERPLDGSATQESFLNALAGARTLAEARKLVVKGPASGARGGRYYSNLGFLLGRGTLPFGASEAECRAYVALVKRDPTVKPGLVSELESALAARFRSEAEE